MERRYISPMPADVLVSEARTIICVTCLAAIEFSRQISSDIMHSIAVTEKAEIDGNDPVKEVDQQGYGKTHLLRHMIRADVDGCGCGCDFDLKSFPAFKGIGAAVGADGDVASTPSPWVLFFFFAMTMKTLSNYEF